MTNFRSSWDRLLAATRHTSRSHSPRNHRDGFAESRKEGSSGPPRPIAPIAGGADGTIDRPDQTMTMPAQRRMNFPWPRFDNIAYIIKRYGLTSNLLSIACALPV